MDDFNEVAVLADVPVGIVPVLFGGGEEGGGVEASTEYAGEFEQDHEGGV